MSVNAFGIVQVPAPGPGGLSLSASGCWTRRVAAGRTMRQSSSVTVPPTVSPPPPALPPSGTRTRIAAILHGRQLRVSGPIAGSGRVAVSWRSKIRGRTVGHGSRAVTIRANRLRVTFAIPRRARVAAATIRVAVRRGGRVVGQARARRSR